MKMLLRVHDQLTRTQPLFCKRRAATLNTVVFIIIIILPVILLCTVADFRQNNNHFTFSTRHGGRTYPNPDPKTQLF